MGHWVSRGRLAQLVEHLVYTERVGGSSPSAPTMEIPHFLPRLMGNVRMVHMNYPPVYSAELFVNCVIDIT
jgi:hypothetical protein